MIEVRLTPLEWAIARHVGRERHAEAVAAGRPDRYGCEAGVDGHVLGAAGEMATGKGLNRYWEPRINTFKLADLGGRLQVRTRSRHSYDLLVRPGDADDDAFLLVTHEPPDAAAFRLVGWRWGSEAKQPCFLQTFGNRPAAYFVPPCDLRDIDSAQPPVKLPALLPYDQGLLAMANDAAWTQERRAGGCFATAPSTAFRVPEVSRVLGRKIHRCAAAKQAVVKKDPARAMQAAPGEGNTTQENGCRHHPSAGDIAPGTLTRKVEEPTC